MNRFFLNSNDRKTPNLSLVDNNHVTDVSTALGVRLVDLPDRLTKCGMGFSDISKFAVNCICVKQLYSPVHPHQQ